MGATISREQAEVLDRFRRRLWGLGDKFCCFRNHVRQADRAVFDGDLAALQREIELVLLDPGVPDTWRELEEVL